MQLIIYVMKIGTLRTKSMTVLESSVGWDSGAEDIDDDCDVFIMIFCCESLSKCLGGIWFLAIQKLRAWGDTPKKAATSLFRLRPWFIIRLFIISFTFSIIINYFCIFYLYIQFCLNKIN